MSKIGDLDYGPRDDENVLQQSIRSQLAKYTNQAWLDSNQAIAADVLDFIGQYAATRAIQDHALLFNYTDRLNSVSWAKSWVAGFVSWYLDPQNAPHRDKLAMLPNYTETCYQGSLIRAQKAYRNIPWTLGYIKRVDGLWLSGVSDQALERINMNLLGCRVDTWKSTKLRGALGYLYLPSQCTCAGLSLKLGDEILSDWIEPPDANHGHPFSTMCSLFNLRKGAGASVHSNDDATGRAAYDVLKAGTWRIVVAERKAPPCVITFFKRA